jgi:hypothetical protein
MTIEVPQDYLPILQLLKLKMYSFDGSTILKKLLDAGLEQVQSDALRDPGDKIELYPSLAATVEGARKCMVYIIDDNDYAAKTHAVSTTWGRPWEFTKTFILALGVTNVGYPFLRHECKDYAEDANFRMVVDKLGKNLGLTP